MYILIEYNGTKEYNEYVKKVKDFLEDEWAATVETIIGSNEKDITLYSENLDRLVDFDIDTDLSIINFYIKNYYENEI